MEYVFTCRLVFFIDNSARNMADDDRQVQCLMHGCAKGLPACRTGNLSPTYNFDLPD